MRLFNRINNASLLRKTTPPATQPTFRAFHMFLATSRFCQATITSRPGTPICTFMGWKLRQCRAARVLLRAMMWSRHISCPRAGRGDKGPAKTPTRSRYRTIASGTYWYHTHFHGESEAQTLLGLSGAIVVENADDDARRRHGIADKS